MEWQDRIEVNPKILMGKPVIKGTRLSVAFLLELMAEGWTAEQILRGYTNLKGEDLSAALYYAASRIEGGDPPRDPAPPDPLDEVIGIVQDGPPFSMADHHDAIIYSDRFLDGDRKP